MKKKPAYTNFFLVVNPIGSKFAKALQGALRERVKNNIFRTNKVREGRSFVITPQPLNKIEQFQRFKARQVSAPAFATNSADARSIECKTLFARTLVNSTNGRGIIEFMADAAQYPRAPLYTEYIPKKAEYRVHVFNGEVIDIQEKKKRRGFEEERNTRVRNSNNGYVYCRDGINPPDGITNLAISAVAACNYQYGAVDIIYNEKRNQCYVLEVNSRPGLMGTTLTKYVDAIIKTFNLVQK